MRIGIVVAVLVLLTVPSFGQDQAKMSVQVGVVFSKTMEFWHAEAVMICTGIDQETLESDNFTAEYTKGVIEDLASIAVRKVLPEIELNVEEGREFPTLTEDQLQKVREEFRIEDRTHLGEYGIGATIEKVLLRPIE